MSVRLSVHPTVGMEILGSHRPDLHEIRKSVERIQVSLKWYKNNGYFT